MKTDECLRTAGSQSTLLYLSFWFWKIVRYWMRKYLPWFCINRRRTLEKPFCTTRSFFGWNTFHWKGIVSNIFQCNMKSLISKNRTLFSFGTFLIQCNLLLQLQKSKLFFNISIYFYKIDRNIKHIMKKKRRRKSYYSPSYFLVRPQKV